MTPTHGAEPGQFIIIQRGRSMRSIAFITRPGRAGCIEVRFFRSRPPRWTNPQLIPRSRVLEIVPDGDERLRVPLVYSDRELTAAILSTPKIASKK